MSEVEKKVAMIPEEVFNAVVEYLLAKPYGEVAQLVDAIKGNVQIGNVPQPAEVQDVSTEQGGTI
jgi:hypothetical protein|tara:strand:- start:1651 stop:1845 length:195 start_codon:yes stop_codon:yes gene_type:complete